VVPWVIAWLGAVVLAIANGIGREALYAKPLGERRAQVVSTGVLIGVLSAYMRGLQVVWPLPTARAAAAVGAAWTAMTLVFEFTFGHFVAHEPWSKLLAQYDVVHGNPWVLVLLCTLLGPSAVRR
jgi:hypothetical protein